MRTSTASRTAEGGHAMGKSQQSDNDQRKFHDPKSDGFMEIEENSVAPFRIAVLDYILHLPILISCIS